MDIHKAEEVFNETLKDSIVSIQNTNGELDNIQKKVHELNEVKKLRLKCLGNISTANKFFCLENVKRNRDFP